MVNNKFRKKLLFTSLILLIGCTQMDIPTSYNKHHISKMVTDYSGYDKYVRKNGENNICDRGCWIYNEKYYRWVFYTLNHGAWITKHAISTWAEGSAFHPECHVLYIHYPKDLHKLDNALRNVLEGEYHNVVGGFSKCFGYNACELWICNNATIKTLTKSEADQYIKDMGKYIQILDY